MFFTLVTYVFHQMLHITGPYTIYRAKSFPTTPSKRSCPRHGERPEQTLANEKLNQIHLLIPGQKSVLERCHYNSQVYTVGILYQWRFNKHLSVNQAVPTKFLLLLKFSVNPPTEWEPGLSPQVANRDVLRLLPSPNWKPESSKSFRSAARRENTLSWPKALKSCSLQSKTSWVGSTVDRLCGYISPGVIIHVHDFVFLFAKA